MRKALAVPVLVLTIGSGGIGAASPAPRTPASDSHARMVEILARIAEREPIRAARAQQVEQLQTRLFQLRRAISDAQRLGIRRALGRALLLHGEYFEALDNFEQMDREIRVLTASQSLTVALTAAFWRGATYLRLAELDNCNDPARCRWPTAGIWDPGDEEYPRLASESFDAALNLARPRSELALASSWLSEIVNQARGSEPVPITARVRLPELEAATDATGVPRLADAADTLGLADPGLAGGLVVDDLDGDGWLDLMVSSADIRDQLRTFRNDGGAFVEVTEESGLIGITGGHDLVQGDFDSDGDLDVLVLRGGWLGTGGSLPNSLLRNEGNFSFVDVSFDVGLGEQVLPTPVGAWADFDRDGDLDLFVGVEADPTAALPSQLLRNDGGRFTDVGAASGTGVLGRVQGAAWGDVDEDGWPDLFLSVFGEPDRLFRNRRDGTFEDIAARAGVAGGTAAGPSWFWDADGDGRLDLLAPGSRTATDTGPDVWYWYADMLGLPHPAEPMRLYLGDGAGAFREVGAEWGLDRVTLASGGNFGDLDNDGRLDFHLATGYDSYDSLVPDLLYRNAGDRFVDATRAAGVGDLRRSAAVTFADFDNDGDQDLFVKRGGLLADDRIADSLYQNPGSAGGQWLGVQLAAPNGNRFGVGARVRVRYEDGAGQTRELTRWVGAAGGRGSSSLRLHFGLGDARRIERIAVLWPGQEGEQQVRDIEPGSRVLIERGRDRAHVLQR